MSSPRHQGQLILGLLLSCLSGRILALDIAQFTPDSVLNQYSVYGTRWVYLPTNTSGMATKGWFGSGGGMKLDDGVRVRTPFLSVVGDLEVRSDSIVPEAKIAVGGNLSITNAITMPERVFKDTIQVGGDLVVSNTAVHFRSTNFAADSVQADIFVGGAIRINSSGSRFGRVWTGSVSQGRDSWNEWTDTVRIVGAFSNVNTRVPSALFPVAAVPAPLGAPPAIAASRLPGWGLALSGPVVALGTVRTKQVVLDRAASKLLPIQMGIVECATLVGAANCNGDTLKPGEYGALNLDGTNILVGEGFYSFQSIDLTNGGGIIAGQPSGGRTVIHSKGDISTSSSSPTHIGPADAIGVDRFGAKQGEFLGGTCMLIADRDASLRMSDRDARIWATISAPHGTASFNSQIKLFGQVFAENVTGQNNVDFGEGAYVPIRTTKPEVRVARGDSVVIRERAPAQTPGTWRDTTIAVTISEMNAYDVSVDWKLESAVATWGVDFTTPDGSDRGTVVIEAGDLSDSIRVRILDDFVYEGAEPFKVVLSNPVKAILPDSAASYDFRVWIDDDDPPPYFRFDTVAVSQTESVAVATVTVRLTSAVDGPSSVRCHLKGGTALAGTDHLFASPVTISFPKGTMVRTFRFAIRDDHKDEPDETIEFALRDPVGLAKVKDSVDSAMTWTILDDDAAPRLVLRDSSRLEGGRGERGALAFRIQLVDSTTGSVLDPADFPDSPVAFRWSTIDGSASATTDTDYVAVGSRPDTLRSVSESRVVDVVGDPRLEEDETLFVAAAPVSGIGASGSRLRATLTIANDDAKPSLRVSGASVVEGAAGTRTPIGFPVVLVDPNDGHFLTSGESPAVPVSFAWNDVSTVLTATPGRDYVGASRRDTIPAGAVSIVLRDTVLGDNLHENAESLLVAIDGASLVAASASPRGSLLAKGAIVDDDAPPTFSVAPASVFEGAPGDRNDLVFVASIDSVSGLDVPFAWTTRDGSAVSNGVLPDYVAASGVDTIRAGARSVSIRVAVVGDHAWEPDDTLFLVARALAGASNDSAKAIGIVLNDDSAPAVRIVGDTVVEPSSGTADIVFRIRLSAPAGRPLSVHLSTVDGTATESVDYVPVRSALLSFSEGDVDASLPVSALPDDLAGEGIEFLRVRVDSMSFASPGSDTSAPGGISDGDPDPGASVFDSSIVEGDVGSRVLPFRIELAGATARAIRIAWRTRSVTATAGVDYRDTSGVLVLPPLARSAHVGVEILGDRLLEPDETFEIVLDSVSDGGAVLLDPVATGTILSDYDDPRVTIDDADSAVREGGVSTFRIHLGSPSSLPTTVRWATRDGSARAAEGDYVARVDSVIFAPMDTTPAVVAVRTLVDSLFEHSEDFRAVLVGAAGGVITADSVGLGTILEEGDSAVAGFVRPDTTVSETVGKVAVAVRLTRASVDTVVVRMSLVGDDALRDVDVSVSDTTFVFLPGSRHATRTISVLDDSLDEDEETARFRLVASTGARIGAEREHLVRIRDDDPLPLVRFEAARSRVSEKDGFARLVATLSTPSGRRVAARVSLSGSALPGIDYREPSSRLLVFAPGELRDTLLVPLVADRVREPLDTLVARFDSLFQADPGDPAVHVVEIEDDDSMPEIRWISALDTTAEGNVVVRRSVALSIHQELSSSVDVVLRSGSAVEGLDFRFDSVRVAFAPGDTVASVDLAILDDTLDEPLENARLALRNADGLRIASDSLHDEWILDDDRPSVLSWTVRDTAVREDAGTLVLVARLDRPSGFAIRVPVALRPGASPALDLPSEARLSDSTLEIPPGAMSDSVTIVLVDDPIDEYDENAVVAMLPAEHVASGDDADVLVLDDDAPPRVSFLLDTLRVPENVGSTAFRIALERPSAKAVSVRVRHGGTATDGGVDHDFGDRFGTIPPGDTLLVLPFGVVDDRIDEPEETVVAWIDSLVSAELDSNASRGVVAIEDDDDAPSVDFASSDTSVAEASGIVRSILRLSNPSSVALRVAIRPSSGSASLRGFEAGSDAVLWDSVWIVEIPAGDTTGVFEYGIVGDGRVESTEDFRLAVVDGEGYVASERPARIAILDDDHLPDVEITRPADSLRTKDSSQTVSWTWDGAGQPDKDTVLAEGWNRISRCATDTAGNTGCDTVRAWADFTPPRVEITRPDSQFLTSRKDVRVCWTVVDSGASWRRVDSPCLDTTLEEGEHVVVREACDSVGNCGLDQVVVRVDLTAPSGRFVHPPDSAHVRVQAQTGRIRWIDDGDTIWVDTVLRMGRYGWNIFVASRADKAGNVGTTSVTLYYEPPSVEGGWYLDTDRDGRIDAAVVRFDSPWESDTLPAFVFRLGGESRQVEPGEAEWYEGGSRGVPASDPDGDVVVDKDGDTVYLAPGIPMTDGTGREVLDAATGEVAVSPVGAIWRDASGKPVHDADGRELFRVPGPGTPDRGTLVVRLDKPFGYGRTSVAATDSASMDVTLSVATSSGRSEGTRFVARFHLADSVAPIIAKAVVVRTESYTGRDSVYVTPSEPVDLDSSGSWIEVKVDGKWHPVPAESLVVLEDGRIAILVEPGEDGSVRPGLEVRFGEGVADTAGNAAKPSETRWATRVEGDPRPPLLEIALPDPVKTVPSEELSTRREGGFAIRATDKRDPSGYQWWKPGAGYVGGSDPEVRATCPDLRVCTGVELYVNRPVKLVVYVYDLSGTYVIDRTFDITQEDIDGLRADKLDRVRIQLQWNMRGDDDKVVASGIYLWRIVSWLRNEHGGSPDMGNQVVKVGVKAPLR